jgi:hypothetical protein
MLPGSTTTSTTLRRSIVLAMVRPFTIMRSSAYVQQGHINDGGPGREHQRRVNA